MYEIINAASSNQRYALKEVDQLEIISLVDNSVDFLSTINKHGVQSVKEWIKERYDAEQAKGRFRLPIAEHGFSMLVKVSTEGKSAYVLFDTGGSSNGIVVNAERMRLNLSEIQCIVISHGHYDHFGGLLSALRAINKANIPVVVHEDMFKIRGVVNADGTVRKYQKFPSEKQASSGRFVRTKQPCLIADDMILVTGEIPRETSFEKGFLQHRVFVNGSWQPDPWVWDDRAIVINVKGKGLAVLFGCAHAGIINTISYAQRVTRIMDIYAIMGGFHLGGQEYESRIKRTVTELRRINPRLIVPSHCTGWRGMCAIAEVLPRAFVWNSVGNLYKF